MQGVSMYLVSLKLHLTEHITLVACKYFTVFEILCHGISSLCRFQAYPCIQPAAVPTTHCEFHPVFSASPLWPHSVRQQYNDPDRDNSTRSHQNINPEKRFFVISIYLYIFHLNNRHVIAVWNYNICIYIYCFLAITGLYGKVFIPAGVCLISAKTDIFFCLF